MSKTCHAGQCRSKEGARSTNGVSSPFARDFQSLWCANQAEVANSVRKLPQWLLENKGISDSFKSAQRKLQENAKCFEKKHSRDRAARTEHSQNRIPKKVEDTECEQCHSVEKDSQLVKLHLALISRIPGGCQTVCQTGFARGDSALLLSIACGPGAHVLSFGEDIEGFTQPGLQCLGEVLQATNSTVTLIEGMPAGSIEPFLEMNYGVGNDIQCDVVHVDGGREGLCAVEDFYLLAHTAH